MTSPAPAMPPASSIEDFATVLTHRIRNLLAGIEGCTDLLTDTLGTPEQRELALRILEGTARIEFVLADVQRCSRPVEINHLPLALGDLVDHLRRTLDPADVARLTVAVSERTRELSADPLLLCQALLLLLQNAFEATPEGIRLCAGFEADGTAFFEVWNPGTIALDDAEARVFAPFFTTKAHNLGIGLTLARRIAEAHGGTLTLAANDARQGTCFTLRLPA